MAAVFSATRHPKKWAILFLMGLAVLCCSYLVAAEKEEYSEQVHQHFIKQVEVVQKSLHQLHQAASNKAPASQLQQQFLQSRIAYKKIATLTEYFNRYETKNLNAPALPRIEEDQPGTIIPPHGYQVLEELIYQKRLPDTAYRQIAEEAILMTEALERVKSTPDLVYAFKHRNIFEALRHTIFRIMALDITGFDSPVALLSLIEAKATIEGMQEILLLYKPGAGLKEEASWRQLDAALTAASHHLERQTNFNAFDRITFIRNYGVPMSARLANFAKDLGMEQNTGKTPVNPAATSLFDPNFFDVDFFSPNERYLLTDKRVALGKALFNDPALSGNGKRSCASCHIPQKAFTDGLPVAAGIAENMLLNRNTPTLWNSVFQTKQFYDSRAMILEHQVGDVVHNVKEMNGSMQRFSDLLAGQHQYAALFREAYPDEKNPFLEMLIANAISSYMRSLVSLNSRFDQFMRGNDTKLTKVEQQGFNLFMGKAKCGTCHFMPVFNGLVPPVFTETESEVLGVPARKKGKPVIDEDLGKYNFTQAIIHKHAFKTPTLRNVALTAPYMHNGVFRTLEEVVDFYNKGGGAGLGIDLDNQTLPADKLNLSRREQKAIVTFLKTLTDTSSGIFKRPL